MCDASVYITCGLDWNAVPMLRAEELSTSQPNDKRKTKIIKCYDVQINQQFKENA